jgi:hypothetical protein
MAKALLGHVGVSADTRLLNEVARLRGRVKELETELSRVTAENDRLAAAVHDGLDGGLNSIAELHQPAMV